MHKFNPLQQMLLLIIYWLDRPVRRSELTPIVEGLIAHHGSIRRAAACLNMPELKMLEHRDGTTEPLDA
jgi:hypothetical protein